MDAGQALDELAAAYWARELEADPLEAHLLGQYPTHGGYQDLSRAAEDSLVADLRSYAARAASLDPADLDDDRRTTRDALISTTTTRAGLLEARLAEIATDPVFGVQVGAPIAFGLLTLPSSEVAEAMAGTLSGLAQHYRDLVARHREGLAAGRAPAAFAVDGVARQVEDVLAGGAAADPALLAFSPPADVDAEAWRGRLEAVVRDEVHPAMRDYLTLLREEVAPVARSDDDAGLGSLPGGAAAYEACLRYFTTTDLTAQEIHDVGLAQVEQLGQEYRTLGPEVVGSDDLATILERMRTDPALHFTEGQALVRASEDALARAEAVMGDWFEVVPDARCAVQSTEHGAKAFYFPPAEDGSRGGTFFINVDDPSSWGTFELESMAFHEGVPGHHLQLAIAAELPRSVPDFRRLGFISAYGEGWGLYSERLSDEMGLYSGPVDRAGMLAADSMRACRLVVDTGLHALGWGRRQAIDYMIANSPLTEAMVRPEVDRYIVSPGQATSYMIGRLEIQRMRREAEQRLGAGFDIKKFHSAVLDSGTIPLAVLDTVVRRRLG